MATKVNRQWRLVSRPIGLIAESDFEWMQEPVPALEEVLLQNEGEVTLRSPLHLFEIGD